MGNPPLCGKKRQAEKKKNNGGKQVVDLGTFMAQTDSKLNKEIGRAGNKPDVELGSLATNDFGRSNMTTATPFTNYHKTAPRKRPEGARPNQLTHAEKQIEERRKWEWRQSEI